MGVYIRVCVYYVCMYICLHVYMHVCMYLRIYLHVGVCVHRYEYMYVGVNVCISVWMFVYRYECIYTGMNVYIQVWKYIYRYECMYVWRYKCMNVCMYEDINVCMSVQMSVCTLVWMYVSIYVHVWMYARILREEYLRRARLRRYFIVCTVIWAAIDLPSLIDVIYNLAYYMHNGELNDVYPMHNYCTMANVCIHQQWLSVSNYLLKVNYYSLCWNFWNLPSLGISIKWIINLPHSPHIHVNYSYFKNSSLKYNPNKLVIGLIFGSSIT